MATDLTVAFEANRRSLVTSNKSKGRLKAYTVELGGTMLYSRVTAATVLRDLGLCSP